MSNIPIDVYATGSAASGSLAFSVSELADITAGTLALGNATTGNIVLGNTGDALSFASVNTLQVISGTGSISEPAASLTVGTLTGSAASSVLISSTLNAIATLGSFSSGGVLGLDDGQALTVTGPVTSASYLYLATASASGSITLAGAVTAPTVSLTTSGGIAQTGGSIAASTLELSGASISLTQPGNAIADIGFLTSANGATLVDSTGFTINGTFQLDSGTASLTAGGSITELAGGMVIVPTLTGSATALSFTQSGNTIATLAGFTTSTGFTLADGVALTVSGPVTDGASIVLSSIGTLTLAANVTAPSVALHAVTATGSLALYNRGDIVLSAGTLGGAGDHRTSR